MTAVVTLGAIVIYALVLIHAVFIHHPTDRLRQPQSEESSRLDPLSTKPV